MQIPLKYNLRNLRRRITTTTLTVVAIAFTVAVVVLIMAMVAGLNRVFIGTGHEDNLVVIRKGSQSELNSQITREDFQQLRNLPGIQAGKNGQGMASPEIVTIIVLPRRGSGTESNVTLRGMTSAGIFLRPQARLIRGHWFTAGQREITISKAVAERFASVNLGATVFLGKGTWTVVGIFDAGQSAYSSEIWADVDQLGSDFNRHNYSAVLLRAQNQNAAALKAAIGLDHRFALEAFLEPDYYAQQTKSGAPLRLLGTIIALVMGLGSIVAAMNTMYAAVANRIREIATLRVLGFSRSAILSSFMVESLLLGLAGATGGLLLVLPLAGTTVGTTNATTFSEAIFKITLDWQTITLALCFALVIGFMGGAAPAWQAARRKVSSALRE